MFLYSLLYGVSTTYICGHLYSLLRPDCHLKNILPEISFQKFRSSTKAIFLIVISSFVLSTTTFASGKSIVKSWVPEDDQWSWLQTSSGEWLKGTLNTLYDKEIEFDSKEFGIVSIGWKDVMYLKTAKVKSLRLSNGKNLFGRVIKKDGMIHLIGSNTEFDSKLLISIAESDKNEWNYWDNEIEFGLNLHTGNSEDETYSASLDMQRRTSLSRLKINYRGLYSESSNVQTANNHRFNSSLDWFFSHRAFFSPLNFEFFRDPFQNIAQRYTYSAQIGYYIIERQNLYWEFSSGPGYQNTEFHQVEIEKTSNISTAILELNTELEWDINRDIEYEFLYIGRWVNSDSGAFIHHFESAFNFDITEELKFRVRYIIDIIAQPTPDENSERPEKTDRNLLFGLVYAF